MKICDDLRQAVLQAAIQGKLTTQRPEDGDARELLKQIAAEKAKLIKEKKIKKEKPLPEITEEEIPFEVPENWVWVRISNATFFQEGPGILAKDFRTEGVPLIRIAGMQTHNVSLEGCNYLDPSMVGKKWEHFRLDLGDIIISTSASLDKIAEVGNEAVGAIPYTGLIRFKMLGGIDKSYFKMFIMSPCYINQIANQEAGGTIKHYGPSHLRKMFIPLPPLAEQHRIVAKVEKLMAEIDELEKVENELHALKTAFPGDMKAALLQAAMQGKLTTQRKEDGDARDLLKQIAKEKAQLIKEKKIKKEKPLPEITEEEIPFDLPDNWVWVRMGDIGETNIGLTYKPSDINEKGTIVLRSSNIQNERMDYSDIIKVSCDIPKKNIAEIGDILICVRNGSRKLVGKCAIIDASNMAFGAFMAIFRSPFNKYVKLFLNSRFFRQDLDGVNTTTINQITQNMLKLQLMPLPPLAEQHRIVAKLEKLLPLCDGLVEE